MSDSQRANPEAAKGNLVSISPFFIVKNLQASISHYIERFGFQLDFQGPPGDLWGFEVTDADGYVIAFFRTRDE